MLSARPSTMSSRIYNVLPPIGDLTQCLDVLEILRKNDVSLGGLVRSVLHHSKVADAGVQSALLDLTGSIPSILSTLVTDENTCSTTSEWMFSFTERTLAAEIEALTQRDAGFHFNASKATEASLNAVTVPRLAEGMRKLAPRTWKLLGQLLSADSNVVYERDRKRKQRMGAEGSRKRGTTRRRGVDVEEIDDIVLEDEDDEWVDEEDGLREADDVDLPEDLDAQIVQRRLKIIEMVSSLVLQQEQSD